MLLLEAKVGAETHVTVFDDVFMAVLFLNPF
jgi:hypothetical protein